MPSYGMQSRKPMTPEQMQRSILRLHAAFTGERR